MWSIVGERNARITEIQEIVGRYQVCAACAENDGEHSENDAQWYGFGQFHGVLMRSLLLLLCNALGVAKTCSIRLSIK